MTSRMSRIPINASALCLGLLLSAVPSHAQTITQVMSHLDAPRGLAWGPEGGLYVTEAGDGTATGPCTPVAVGSNCYSETGKITMHFGGKAFSAQIPMAMLKTDTVTGVTTAVIETLCGHLVAAALKEVVEPEVAKLLNGVQATAGAGKW